MPSLQSPTGSNSSVQTLKAVDKALELPLVSSACSEMTRIASPLTPYVSSLSKVATQVEEKVAPHIPAVICRSSAAAVERADHLACEGIDQLTEKLPQLKEDTPKLLEGTKTTMSSYVSAATDYAASFPAAQVALKMTDSGLDVVEDVLKKVGSDESAVKKFHHTANTIRVSGVKRAGTERAKKIEEATIMGALAELTGLVHLMSLLGLQLEAAGLIDGAKMAN